MRMAATSSADDAEPRKIDVAKVGRGTTEDHGRAEEQRLFPQLLVFDDARLGVHIVRERLEVEGCGGDLFLGCVVTVGQVPRPASNWKTTSDSKSSSNQRQRAKTIFQEHYSARSTANSLLPTHNCRKRDNIFHVHLNWNAELEDTATSTVIADTCVEVDTAHADDGTQIQYRMMCHPPLFHQRNNHQPSRYQHVEKCGYSCQKTLRDRRPHCSVSQQTHNKSAVTAERNWNR